MKIVNSVERVMTMDLNRNRNLKEIVKVKANNNESTIKPANINNK